MPSTASHQPTDLSATMKQQVNVATVVRTVTAVPWGAPKSAENLLGAAALKGNATSWRYQPAESTATGGTHGQGLTHSIYKGGKSHKGHGAADKLNSLL